MYSQEALKQGYLNKKQKLLRIGAHLEISNIKQLIVKMYLGGMSCAEISEDFNQKIPNITITAKAISDEIGRQGALLGVKYIRNKSESFTLEIILFRSARAATIKIIIYRYYDDIVTTAKHNLRNKL